MNDFYLKTTNETDLYQVLLDLGLLLETEGVYHPVEGVSLDVIGQLEGIEGFHANLRGSLSSEQIASLPIIPTPVNPVRVWF